MFSVQFLLLILFSTISSFLSNNRRFERDESSLTKFPEYGEYNLTLQNVNSLEFQICCDKHGGCSDRLLFCFETLCRKQPDENIYDCGDGTCAYKLDYNPNNEYFLGGTDFTSPETCLIGKIAYNLTFISDASNNKKEFQGCPMAVKPGNRLKLFIKSIPDGVTVKALNAKKYVESTPTTALPNNTKEVSEDSEEGMSDGVKYTLIGIGILLFVLILGGVLYGIYRLRKSKKSPKAAPKSTVYNVEKQTQAKPEKPSEQKEEEGKTKEKESKAKEHPKVPPSTVVSSAEPQKPSKEPTANPSAEPAKQASREPLPSAEQMPKPATEIPKAPPTLADLVTRAERNGKRAKMGNTFDKTKKPFYENVFDAMLHCKWISEDDLPEQKKEKHLRPP